MYKKGVKRKNLKNSKGTLVLVPKRLRRTAVGSKAKLQKKAWGKTGHSQNVGKNQGASSIDWTGCFKKKGTEQGGKGHLQWKKNSGEGLGEKRNKTGSWGASFLLIQSRA